MSSTTKRQIAISADLIKDVRLGAIGELHSVAGRLDVNGDAYLSSEHVEAHGVAYHDYMDAFDDMRGWLDMLEELGDDFRIEEAVERVKPAHAARLGKAVDYRGEMLRLRLDEATNGGINGVELVDLAQRIAALEDFAAYAHDVETLHNAEHADEDEEA